MNAKRNGPIFHGAIEALASLRFTVLIMLSLVAAVIWSSVTGATVTWSIAPPLLLLTVNSLAAVIYSQKFRDDTWLLAFHLALVALVALAAASRLTYLRGHVEVTEGLEFESERAEYEMGPLHTTALRKVRFQNSGFTIDYDTGLVRGDTHNKITWVDNDGYLKETVIGDDYPFVSHGYQFYTTGNKGFAPVFTWFPDNGASPVSGSVHLPSYPLNRDAQELTWRIPGGDRVYVELYFSEKILDSKEASRFKPPDKNYIVLIQGKKEVKLKPSEIVKLPGGALRYEGVRTWMGYFIFYDRAKPWMLAACLIAVISITGHYISRFSASPWLEVDLREKAGG